MQVPRLRWRHWALIIGLTAMAAALPPPGARAQATRVVAVGVTGNTRINKETILAVVSTKAGDDYSPERIERDRRAIEALGWFKVVAPPAVQQVAGGVRIVFVVTEWPLVNGIQVSGNTVISQEAIRAAIKTRTGQVFNLAQWQADAAAIEDLYKQKSYVAQVL